MVLPQYHSTLTYALEMEDSESSMLATWIRTGIFPRRPNSYLSNSYLQAWLPTTIGSSEQDSSPEPQARVIRLGAGRCSLAHEVDGGGSEIEGGVLQPRPRGRVCGSKLRARAIC